MLRCCYRGALVWAMGSMLLVGCATSSRPAHSQSGKASAQLADADSEADNEKLIQAHAHYAQALIYEMDEKSDKALEEYSQAALNDPANEELVLEVSRRYLQKKEPERALDLLIAAAALPGASGEVFARLGLVYSQLGEDAKAVTTTQTAIQRSPRSLAGYQNLFLIQLQKGRLSKALESLNAAAGVPDTDADFLIGLAGLYASFERQAPSQKAIVEPASLAVLNRAAKLNPPTPQLRLKLADNYNLMGDTTNAVKIYVELLNRYGDLPALRDDIRPKLADIYVNNHDSAKAMEQLEAIVRDDPANPRAYYWLGWVANDEGKLSEAADYYQKALLMNEDFRPVYYELAQVQVNLDRPKEALATLEKARAKFSSTFMGEFLAALAYNREKDFTNALGHFTSAEVIARATEPERLNKYFYFEEGATYERKGDFDQAEQCFEKSLQLEPNFPEALNYFGFMLAEHGLKLEKAREMIEKAVKLQPKSAAYVDSLGWVLYKLDRPQEALPQIQKAISLSEEADATLYDHLGDVYAALKQPDKAREAWRKSLSVEPNDQIRKKLDQASGKSK